MSAASRRRGVVAAIVTVAALFLAGCTTGEIEPGPTSTATPTVQPTPTPTEDPEFVVGGTAGQNRPFFEFVLSGLLEATPTPSSAAVVDALAAAGFDRATIEVTADTTPVGQPADSILIGIPIDGQCLLGQIIDGALGTQLADVLGTGRCLVGNIASLD